MSYSIPTHPLNVSDEIKLVAAFVRERLSQREREQLSELLFEAHPGAAAPGAVGATQLFTNAQLATEAEAIATGAFATALMQAGWSPP